MSGDRVDIYGKSYYFQNNISQTNYNVPVLDVLSGLLGTPSGATSSKGVTASNLNGMSSVTGLISSFLSDPNRNNNGTLTTPRAYINWILFDENFKAVSSNFDRVGSANDVKSHELHDISVTKNGFLYVYVNNESPVNVFFDNLQVIHTRGPVLEETHYYPFGLTMAAISSKAAGGIVNKYEFSGKEKQEKEFSDGSGLELYDFDARIQDPQLGRWWQVDPLSDQMPEFSSYNYAFNNPITFIDPDGMSPIDSDFEKGETKNKSIIPGESHYISSTFVKPDGTVLEYRDDGDFRIYMVSDEKAWVNGGKSKEGLSWVGLENPSHTYTSGDRISLFNYDHNVLAKPSGQIDQNYDIESYLFPGIGLYKLYKWYKVYKAAKALANLTKSQLKSISSLKSQIAKHQTKLAEYIKDPMKFDNKGFLKNSPNDAVRQRIIQSRINHLQQEIKTFQNNIQKIINGQ